MAEIDDAEIIGGARFRSTEKKDKYWTDPLVSHDLPDNDFSVSVTYMPQGTKFEEDQEEAGILDKIKKKKFKGSDLSDYTKEKFKEENIAYEDDQGEDEQ